MVRFKIPAYFYNYKRLISLRLTVGLCAAAEPWFEGKFLESLFIQLYVPWLGFVTIADSEDDESFQKYMILKVRQDT